MGSMVGKVFAIIGAMVLTFLLYTSFFGEDGAWEQASKSAERPLAQDYELFSNGVKKGKDLLFVPDYSTDNGRTIEGRD